MKLLRKTWSGDGRDSVDLSGGPRDLIEGGEEVIRIDGLRVVYRRAGIRTEALRGISMSLKSGQVLGIAGESGSGKSTAAFASIGLLPVGTVVTGSIRLRGQELVGLSEKDWRQIRGSQIAMIFQETGTALNPVMRVGDQLMAAIRAHKGGSRADCRAEMERALNDVQLRDPQHVLESYPDELSGGMCQRVIIAMALSCGSFVLLADEPTTALDVSVQHEVIELIGNLVTERQLAAVFVSHDLGVLAEICDELVVMYNGEIVESGPIDAILQSPAHPYTKALLACVPRLHGDKVVLPEMLYNGNAFPEKGCRFRQRCSFEENICGEHPELLELSSEKPNDDGRKVRCWRADRVMEQSNGVETSVTGAAPMTEI